ncbi:Peptide-methionine (S)-S-oxide reductase [Physocladia obscura]|uniref:peptide-methionine (S)-S-oxide reductase n=1 Tax=Physocladia obscura TaxID=109957 RepID=A0AAD5SWJ1_9FUNG|nr:Peptide-methionine (S)-S-oxide reductase [Physocladia obscura]
MFEKLKALFTSAPKEPRDLKAGASYATLGAGCFWGVETAFRRKFGTAIVDGQVRVGYSGGTAEGASYRTVCNGTTGHAESVHFEFNPERVSYAEILDFFFRMHDPTTANQQGGDRGTQYRSVIFCHDNEQRAAAITAVKKYQSAFGKSRISTKIENFDGFWDAEEYHQQYLDKNPSGYHCSTHFERTWQKIADEYGGIVDWP